MSIPQQQQAFFQQMIEVQKEMNKASQSAKACESQIYALKRNIRKNELAIIDIDKAKDSKAIYLPLGKAFICRKPEFVKEEFGKINKEWAKEIQELEKNQKYYEVKKAEKEAIVKAGIERLTKK